MDRKHPHDAKTVLTHSALPANRVERNHSRRLFTEQLGQLLVLASSFLDRLLLTGLLVRRWRVDTFETWAACLAVSALASLFELGFNLYFNNQMMIEMERGENAALRKTYAIGNTMFAAGAILSFICLIAYVVAAHPFAERIDNQALIATIVLSAASAAKIGMCAVNSLYRANRDFGRFSTIQAISEFTRIASIVVAVFCGGHLVSAAFVSAASTTAVSVIFVLVDTRKRYFPHAYLLLQPRRAEMTPILRISTVYMAQAVPLLLFTAVPVLALGKMQLASGMLGAFVLMRTLANLARAPLQSLGIVFGQEVGRRLAIDDRAGAQTVMRRGARLFAVVSGLSNGFLLIAGAELMRLWTGTRALFDWPLLIAALAPMILGSAAVLAHNILSSYQSPKIPAFGRWVQLLLSVIAFAALRPLPAPLRMMSSLAIGELAGYAPIAYWAIARLIPSAGIRFHVANLATVLSSILLAGGTTWMLERVFVPFGQIGILIGFAIIGALLAIATFALGIDQESRQQILAHTMTLRFYARFGSQKTDSMIK